MKMCLIYQLLIVLYPAMSSAQGVKAINNDISNDLHLQGSNHGIFKATLIYKAKADFSLGLGYGMWQEHPWLQYSLNTACMLRLGKGFLGNYRNGAEPGDNRSHCQFVFMFTPILTTRLSRGDYAYQEIEPFYLGTPNGVFSKYKNSLSLGSTFTIAPRGTYKNVTTVRNRAQQVFLFSLNIKKFNLTIIDDFFPLFTEVLQLGDNWDRFFTGGGFVRYRFNKEYTFHLYSEVYTGINRTNAFLHPDIISYYKRKGGWKRKNYAFQDPSQEYFNSSWLIGSLSYTHPRDLPGAKGVFTPDYKVFIGSAAPWTMFSQNWVHNTFCYDQTNGYKLHYFMPRNNVPGNYKSGTEKFFVGGALSYNIIPQ